MARGLVVPFSADLRQWGRAIRNIGKDLDDVADDFRDLERASDREGDQIERNMEDAADDIEAAFRNLGREVEGEFDRMERAARNADIDVDISEDIRSGAGSAKRAAGALIGEVADELTEAWGEAVRSGDYGEAIRETFSNLAQVGGAVFGPIGAAGGAIAGLLLTGIYDRLTSAAEKEALAAAVEQAFDNISEGETLVEQGRNAYKQYIKGFVEEAQIGEELAAALGVESAAEAFLQVQQEADLLGTTVETVAGAYLGQRDAIAEIARLTEQNEEAEQRIAEQSGKTATTASDALTSYKDQTKELDDQLGVLQRIADTAEREAAANERALAAQRAKAEILGSQREDPGAGGYGAGYVYAGGGNLIP